MLCYECSRAGKREQAVATCRGCQAGLCETHLRETAVYFATGGIRITCPHDTWLATPPGQTSMRPRSLAGAD